MKGRSPLLTSIRVIVLTMLGAGGALWAQGAGAPPAALAQLRPGLWELKGVGRAAPPTRRICIADLRQILQPLHNMPLCQQFIADQAPDHVTITYDCGARGQGRTALRIETPRLVQLDSQGMANGRPFAAQFEGRHVGACNAGA